MLGTFIFIEFIIILVFIAVIVMQIILFFKIWKMTDDVAELKNFLLMRFSKHGRTNAASASTRYRLATYKPKNLKVIVMEKEGEHVYKCMSVDGKSLYYFNEENLQYEDNGDNESAPETENNGNVKTSSDDNANEPQP